MPFKITARTLLELGGELISSDAIALYELVKNGVDAGSPIIRITVQSVLLHSRFQQALELIDEKRTPLITIRHKIEGWLAGDAPPAAKRNFLDMLSIVGNNYNSFRTRLINAYYEHNYIEIQDDGDGMSLDDLQNVYLTIGTRSRRHEKSSWNEDEEPVRILLGDKGVGRLSVMRLGEKLCVTTTKAGESNWNKLDIDWRRFSHDSDALLHEISIIPLKGESKSDKSIQGTIIRIFDLKTDWNKQYFQEILNTDFARMVDPFDRHRANRLFRIYFNDEQVTLPQVAKRLIESAHAEVSFKFSYDENRVANISGEMIYRLHTNKRKTISYNEVQIVSFTKSISDKIAKELGPFKANFIWFNRKFLTAFEGLGTKDDVKKLVKQWAGGLMVFRDGFRINPYGGPDDDWLLLDKKAFARSGYKLNRQQIIGRVELNWRNKFLVEQTNREGLVDNDHKNAFIKILQRILEDFKSFSQKIETDLKREELTTIDVLKQRVLDAKTEVHKRIRKIAVEVPEQAGPLNEVERLINQLASHIDGASEIITDYQDERRKFVHLAGLGLMVELILHELGRATGNTLGTLDSVDPTTLPGRLPSVFKTLESQLKTLQKRINTLDPLSTSRRQIKESFSTLEVVQQIVDARLAQSKRHKINLYIDNSSSSWRIKAVKGMFIQILENFLSNSFYWLKHQAIVDSDFNPIIKITLDSTAKTISVTDNGPGVETDRAEEIFEPFVTSKPPGQGNGLGLYITRELAGYHDWSVDVVHDSKIPMKNLNMFVLDLSGRINER